MLERGDTPLDAPASSKSGRWRATGNKFPARYQHQRHSFTQVFGVALVSTFVVVESDEAVGRSRHAITVELAVLLVIMAQHRSRCRTASCPRRNPSTAKFLMKPSLHKASKPIEMFGCDS